jgi:hypothetical protein
MTIESNIWYRPLRPEFTLNFVPTLSTYSNYPITLPEERAPVILIIHCVTLLVFVHEPQILNYSARDYWPNLNTSGVQS